MNQYTKLITFPCVSSAPINMEIEPVINQVEDSSNSINITWLSPSNNNGIKETIFYEIQCFICVKSVCNKSCTDLLYTPSRHNLTKTSVRASGLVDGGTYQFRIYPKNSLNSAIPRRKWQFATSKPYTFLTGGNTLISILVFKLKNL